MDKWKGKERRKSPSTDSMSRIQEELIEMRIELVNTMQRLNNHSREWKDFAKRMETVLFGDGLSNEGVFSKINNLSSVEIHIDEHIKEYDRTMNIIKWAFGVIGSINIAQLLAVLKIMGSR